MNVLITGSAGFIAQNLIDWFDCRYEIHSMDIQTIGDVTNIDDCLEMTRDKDVVIHLAALPGVQQSIINPMQCFKTNAIGTSLMIEASMFNKVSKFIFASSNAADNRDSSPYAMSKWMAEYFISHSPINSVVLRFSNVYGPYSEHKNSLVHAGIKALKNGQNINVYGDGSHERDFIHVNDVCRAIELAMLSEDKHSTPIEIGTGKATSVLDVLSELVLVSDTPFFVNYLPALQEQERVVANTTRASQELGFLSEIPLRDGLRMTWEKCR